jgi:nucleotide-binding universal stress UspA family protein
MKRVVVAVDGSEVSRALMGYAFHYAYREGDTELYFLHVVETTKYAGFEPGPLWTGAYLPCDEDRMNQARASIEAGVQEARKSFPHEIPNMSVTVVLGVPYQEIVDFAKGKDADMIMIGHQGLSNLERFFIGSVAAKVVAHAPCSVYVLRPKAVPGTGETQKA